MRSRLLLRAAAALSVLAGSAPAMPVSDSSLQAAPPADRMESLVQADRSASVTSWKRGLRIALLEASDPGGVLLLPGAPLVSGIPGALRALTGTPAPLSPKIAWDPLGLEISADSSLALLWGTASHAAEAEPPATGRFVSMWRYCDERWKIVAFLLQGAAFAYDGPAMTSAPAAPPGKPVEKFFEADREFARLAADSGASIAFQRWAAPDAMMFGRRGFIIRGTEMIGKAVDGRADWSWAPVAGGGSSTGDLGWTAGEAVITPGEGASIRTKYLSVWRTNPDGSVRFILDAGNARP